jgi:hypothetical protein
MSDEPVKKALELAQGFMRDSAELVDKPRELRDTIDDPPMYFGRDGKPMSLQAWCNAWSDPDYRLVATDEINGHRVTTMWMGTDIDCGYFPPPNIFATALFKDGKMVDEVTSATELEARATHKAMCSQAGGSRSGTTS